VDDLKRRLVEGEALLGTMVNMLDHPDLARIFANCGLDFFMIDCEHGYFDPSAAGRLFALAREVGIPPFVRIPEVRRDLVLMYLEMGASGILLPQTETVEQAEALVSYAKYAPLGDRGVSLMRPHTRYQKVEAAEYMRMANERTVLAIQIESVAAVENVDKLIAVEGIDLAFVGPGDLSQSMGIPGQTRAPVFVETVERIITAVKAQHKFAGIHCMKAEDARFWIDKGTAFNLWANEIVMLMNAARAGMAEIRAARGTEGAAS